MTLQLTENALRVLEARYLQRDAAGHTLETPEALFRRVARSIAQGERRFGGVTAAEQWEARFLDALRHVDFLPNSPTLMNAGTSLGQLSACFVLPVEDSMVEIFETLKLAALIQQSGGGTGFAFSRLRPRGDPVASTGGSASGPVSFMRIFDCATEHIKQGGRRRGANMGVLRVDHPDIEAFVDAKLDGQSLQNFNLSVGASDAFMEAVIAERPFALRHPRTGQRLRRVSAAALFQRIVQAAWQTGDPGLIFLDTINRLHPTPAIGAIEATNPCGEVPLLPYEACNLGSINLSHMVRQTASGYTIDWPKLAAITRLAMRFLDDVIEVSHWPAPQITSMVRANRKVGLGVMGFAELLIFLGIPYASEQATGLAEDLMRYISEQAQATSAQLAQERGVFPNWQHSIYAAQGRRLRNATCTSIAPTGTISILAGTSASIEPLFALAYRRHALEGQTLVDLNPLFLQYARRERFYSEHLVQTLYRQGSLAGLAEAPAAAKDLFKTALEIAPVDHLRIQAAFQKHVENAVSKTINLPHTATAEDIAAVYQQAWECQLKGVTVFRYGSTGQQVLEIGQDETLEEHEHYARCDPYACKL
jgi:ribonucleoside-diphosphate reductase alpha chain